MFGVFMYFECLALRPKLAGAILFPRQQWQWSHNIFCGASLFSFSAVQRGKDAYHGTPIAGAVLFGALGVTSLLPRLHVFLQQAAADRVVGVLPGTLLERDFRKLAGYCCCHQRQHYCCISRTRSTNIVGAPTFFRLQGSGRLSLPPLHRP